MGILYEVLKKLFDSVVVRMVEVKGSFYLDLCNKFIEFVKVKEVSFALKKP